MDDDGQASSTRSSPAPPARAGCAAPLSRPRAFDPARVAGMECAAWVAYYQRRWPRLLVSAVGLVRAGLGMSWPRTLRAAWYVLRAIMFWAPLRDNDPPRAQAYMRRFYDLVKVACGQPRDPAESARLEIEWWRVHRVAQQAAAGPSDELVDALARLYAFVLGVPEPAVRPAAFHRCQAMEISDRWVAQGSRSGSPLIASERTVLIRSYEALLAAIGG